MEYYSTSQTSEQTIDEFLGLRLQTYWKRRDLDKFLFAPKKGIRRNHLEHKDSALVQQEIKAKLEQYASNAASNGITNSNIVFETKIKIIDILQVRLRNTAFMES